MTAGRAWRRPIFGAIGMIALALTPASEVWAAPDTPATAPWSAPASTAVVHEDIRVHSQDADLAATLYLPAGRQALGAVVVTHAASRPMRKPWRPMRRSTSRG